MKLLKLTASALVSIAVMANASVAETCKDGTPYDEAKVSAAVDRYYQAPFGAVSWRVMNGLGDPGLEPHYGYGDHWTDEEQWQSLVTKLVPGMAKRNLGYDCRIGHALATLKARIARYGETDPYLHHWIAVQEAVFAACSDGQAAATLPPSMDGTSPELADLQRQDRAYQDASVDFYRESYDEALRKYRAIAAAPGEHRASARYMVANTLANAKRLDEASREIDSILADPSLAPVHVIASELRGYVAHLADNDARWSGLLDDTVKSLEATSATIEASAASREDYRRALNDIDYMGIRGRNDDWWLTGKLPEDPTLSKAVYDGVRRHPIAVWLIAGQSVNDLHLALPWQVIGKAWAAKMSEFSAAAKALVPPERAAGTAWVAFDAETAGAEAADPQRYSSALASAVSATRASCGSAPETAAVGTLLFHSVRLSVQRGKAAQAYALLDAFPFKATRAYNRTLLRLGQFLVGSGLVEEGRAFASRFLTTATYSTLASIKAEDEFATSFARLEAILAKTRDGWREALLKRTRPADDPLINFLSNDELGALADLDAFGPRERALFSRVAWTRDYARDQTPSARETESMLELNPAIKAVADDVARSYPATDPQRRWLLTILRTPRLGILTSASSGWNALDLADDATPPTEIDQYDHNDRNWWCPFDLDRHLGELRDDFDELTGNAAARATATTGSYAVGGGWYRSDDRIRSLLDADVAKSLDASRDDALRGHPVIRTIAWKELRRLGRVPSAPKLLVGQAVQWARRGGKPENGVTEALGLGVRAARYGCSWAGSHKAYTQSAVGILRTMFADSDWAKRTPYWYDCLWQAYGTEAGSTTKRPTCQGPQWPKQQTLQ